MSEPSIENLRRIARRKRWQANLAFLAAGLGFGSAVYLARTRFATMVASGRSARWFVLVAVGVGVFTLAARLHAAAQRADETLRDALSPPSSPSRPPSDGT